MAADRIRDLMARLILRWGGIAVDPSRTFIGDGLISRHNHDFAADPAFRAAYARGVEVAGWDYGFPWRVHTALWAARSAAEVPGDFLELGTGRGVMASCILEHLEWSSLDKTFWLFDSFLPYTVNSTTGRQDPSQPVSPFYAVNAAATARSLEGWPRVRLVVGTLPDALARLDADAIAFAHIDLNVPEPEVAGLRALWPRLSSGAVVLFDDYAYFGHRNQYAAIGAAADELGSDVLSLPTGQGLLIKR